MPFEGRPLRNARFQVGMKKAFLIFEPLKTHFGYPFWDPKLGNKFDQKKNDEHRGPSGASKTKTQPFQNP